jgi:histidine ammonia-lyase
LQEDHLCHATPAALKALEIIENAGRIVAIELLAAAQAYDLQTGDVPRAPYTDSLWRNVRRVVPTYRDDRPLAEDMAVAFRMIADAAPPPLPNPGKMRPAAAGAVGEVGRTPVEATLQMAAGTRDAAANEHQSAA